MKWIAGADHGGYLLKNHLVELLTKLGDEVIDIGTQDGQSVDYPSYGAEVARRVAAGEADRGLVVCGSGIGISIAANKVHGARCALVHEPVSAALARQHNDANVIALGARIVGPALAEGTLLAFRGAEFEGGRHQRRVDQLRDLDQPEPKK